VLPGPGTADIGTAAVGGDTSEGRGAVEERQASEDGDRLRRRGRFAKEGPAKAPTKT
jgi:hypothetical protein